MHTWTKEEISILKANADLTSEEIRSRFFPDLTISNINSARRKYDCRKDRNWKPEKIEALVSELSYENKIKLFWELTNDPDIIVNVLSKSGISVERINTCCREILK